MPIEVATHSGSFHADDVLAYALIRRFVDAEATVVRTRDLERMREADVVIDVGGVFEPDTCRFDHHQVTYEGDRSSAGMVLDWLEKAGHVHIRVAEMLRAGLVNYVDAVDNGRTTPVQATPCFTRMIGLFNQGAETADEYLAAYRAASDVALRVVDGMVGGLRDADGARRRVVAAMEEAEKAGSNVMYFDGYFPWKGAYFEAGGRTHRTEYVVFPADEKWRVLAIPPEPGSFDNKRPLPEEWAGLVDDELSKVIGVQGAVFCHKNRFLAVFETRDGVLEAMNRWNLMQTEEVQS